MGGKQSRRRDTVRTPTMSTATGPDPMNPLMSSRDAMRIAMEQSIQDAPMPLGWDQSFTSKGNTYFIDHLSKSTTWNDPRSPDTVRRLTRGQPRKPPAPGKPPNYVEDFYSKSQHFRARLRQIQNDDGDLTIAVSRDKLLEDSIDLISNLDPLTLTRRLHIKFDGESGLDYGGMSREWFLSLSTDILEGKYKLFVRTASNEYRINPNLELKEMTLERYYFVGIVIGLALYHGKLFNGYFVPAFYKSLLEQEVTFDDLKSVDEQLWKGLKFMLDNDGADTMDMNFTVTIKGDDGKEKEVELVKDGKDQAVTDKNKQEYAKLCLQYHLGQAKQMNSIKMGFKQFVSADLLQGVFSPTELAQLIGGDNNINVADMEANVDFQNGFSDSSQVVVWFFDIVRAMAADQQRLLLKFITGTTRVPVGGFAHLYGANGPQKFTLNRLTKTSGLPAAHSCFNRLDLPDYKDKDELKKCLLIAISETQGFDIE